MQEKPQIYIVWTIIVFEWWHVFIEIMTSEQKAAVLQCCSGE